MEEKSTLHYFAGATCPPISFAPEEQDYMTNVTISQHLIGTLIFYGKTGQFEPFLAKSWTVSDDGKNYHFFLRNDIFAEDGTPLNSNNFIKSLEILLRIESKQSSPTDFDLLEGWEDFFLNKKKHIKGIVFKNDSEFELIFNKKPIGLLKYLSLPKFGFLVERDFKNGSWIDKTKITSTGPYKLISYDLNGEIVLEQRAGFPGILENSAKKVVIKRENNDTFVKDHSINLYIQPTNLNNVGNGTKIFGPKYMLSGFALSPKIGPFQSVEIRKRFQTLVENYLIRFKADNLPGALPTQSFYNSSVRQELNLKDAKLGEHFISKKSPYKVRVVRSPNLSFNEQTLYKKVIDYALDKLGYQYEMEIIDRSMPDWMSKLTSYDHYDIRIFTVATGATFIPWAVKMMFCGKIGVGFPDINGSICNLVAEVEQNKYELPEAEKKLEKIIFDEAQVIPFYYHGASWLVSKDIDLSDYSIINYYPRFDQLKLK